MPMPVHERVDPPGHPLCAGSPPGDVGNAEPSPARRTVEPQPAGFWLAVNPLVHRFTPLWCPLQLTRSANAWEGPGSFIFRDSGPPGARPLLPPDTAPALARL